MKLLSIPLQAIGEASQLLWEISAWHHDWWLSCRLWDLDVFHVHLQPRWGYGRDTLAKVLTYIRDEAGRGRFRSWLLEPGFGADVWPESLGIFATKGARHQLQQSSQCNLKGNLVWKAWNRGRSQLRLQSSYIPTWASDSTPSARTWLHRGFWPEVWPSRSNPPNLPLTGYALPEPVRNGNDEWFQRYVQEEGAQGDCMVSPQTCAAVPLWKSTNWSAWCWRPGRVDFFLRSTTVCNLLIVWNMESSMRSVIRPALSCGNIKVWPHSLLMLAECHP